jgi:hypothetical protein
MSRKRPVIEFGESSDDDVSSAIGNIFRRERLYNRLREQFQRETDAIPNVDIEHERGRTLREAVAGPRYRHGGDRFGNISGSPAQVAALLRDVDRREGSPIRQALKARATLIPRAYEGRPPARLGTFVDNAFFEERLLPVRLAQAWRQDSAKVAASMARGDVLWGRSNDPKKAFKDNYRSIRKAISQDSSPEMQYANAHYREALQITGQRDRGETRGATIQGSTKRMRSRARRTLRGLLPMVIGAALTSAVEAARNKLKGE